jgi:hypothetical protein
MSAYDNSATGQLYRQFVDAAWEKDGEYLRGLGEDELEAEIQKRVYGDPKFKEKLDSYNAALQDWYVTNKHMTPEQAKAQVEGNIYKDTPWDTVRKSAAKFQNGGNILYVDDESDPNYIAAQDSSIIADATKDMIKHLNNTTNANSWVNYSNNWYNKHGANSAFAKAFQRLTKLNKRKPEPWKVNHSILPGGGNFPQTAVEYKPPTRKVIVQDIPHPKMKEAKELPLPQMLPSLFCVLIRLVFANLSVLALIFAHLSTFPVPYHHTHLLHPWS